MGFVPSGGRLGPALSEAEGLVLSEAEGVSPRFNVLSGRVSGIDSEK